MPDMTSVRLPNVARCISWTRWHDNWAKRPDFWLGPYGLESTDWVELERMLKDYFTDEIGSYVGT